MLWSKQAVKNLAAITDADIEKAKLYFIQNSKPGYRRLLDSKEV